MCGLNNKDPSAPCQLPTGQSKHDDPNSAWQQWEGGSWLVDFLILQVISKLVQASLRTGLSPRQIIILNGRLS